MEHPDVSMMLEALTRGTSAERFGEFLAAPPPADTGTIPFAPSFEMPLVAAHVPPPDPLSPSSSFLTPTALDLLPSHIDYSLPVSAVTGVSAASSRSEPVIRKKRARSRSVSSPVKPKPESVLAVTAAAAAAAAASMDARNMSATSDVSSLSPRESSPVSKNIDENPKLEIHPVKMEALPLPPHHPHLRPSASSHSHPATVQVPCIPSSPPLPKSHTRKCREKVTKQFENLLEVLPHPPKGVEVKHKAQILEYTIKIFRYLLLRRTALQTEVALASASTLRQWMNSVITSASLSRDPHAAMKPISFSAVLEPFVGLYCVKKRWTYAEMWLVDHESNHTALASCVFNTDDDGSLRRYDSFANISRSRFAAPRELKSGIISRAICTGRPEWLNDLSADQAAFNRAGLAAEHGMCVGTAVPVMLDATRCAAVLFFADEQPHTFSTSDLTTLLDYTSVLGGLYMQYVNGFPQQQMAGQRTTSAQTMDIKPKLENGDPVTNGHSDLGIAGRHLGMQGMPTGLSHGLVPPASETSYFGEAEFLANR